MRRGLLGLFAMAFFLGFFGPSKAFAAAGHGPIHLFSETLKGDYKLLLYFGDSAPFTDEIHIDRTALGAPSGTMHVPNDFDGILENITEMGDEFAFDILVPKNASRPVDMVFHYVAHAFPGTSDQLTGFVTLIKSDGQPTQGKPYLASFVAFRKKP